MVYIRAEPVRTNALRPFTRFDALRHFHHPARGAQHQRHDRIGDGLGQHGRGMHQQHPAGVQRLDVEVVIANGNGGGRTQLRHLLQQRGVNLFAGAQQAFSLGEGLSVLRNGLRPQVFHLSDGKVLLQTL